MGLGPTAMAAVSAEASKVPIGPFVINAQAPDEGSSTPCATGAPTNSRSGT